MAASTRRKARGAQPLEPPPVSPFADLTLPDSLPDGITREEAQAHLDLLKEGGKFEERNRAKGALAEAGVFPMEVLYPGLEPAVPPPLRIVTGDVAPAKAQAPAVAGPRNLEAEMGDLACMIAHNEAIGPIEEIAPPDHWEGVAQRPIFEAILALKAEGKPIDRVLIRERLSGNPEYAVSGALAALDELGKAKAPAPDPERGLEYARLIREKFHKRKVRQGMRELKELSSDEKMELGDFVSAANHLLTDISARGNDWEAPQLDGLLNPVPFPLDAIPGPLAEIAAEVASQTRTPVETFLLPALTFAGSNIGMSVGLRLKTRWIEHPNLWTAFVLKSGSGKTPALDQAQFPIMEIFKELLQDHAFSVAMRERARQKAERRRKDNPTFTVPADLLEDPPLKRNMINDATFEAISKVLSVNPRGLVNISDELSGWLKGMDQYKAGGGNDLERWMSAWSGQPIVVDREKHEGIPRVVHRPFLAATGGIQPFKLFLLSSSIKQGDGFVDRILWSYPEGVPQQWTEDVRSDLSYERYCSMLRTLWNIELPEGGGGRSKPRIVELEPAAREAWIAWFNVLCGEFEASDCPEHIRRYWSKLRIQCARLALILDMVDRAYSRGWKGRPGDVRLSSLESAFKLIEYFKAHFRRVYAAIGGEKFEHAGASAILKWLQGGNRRRFTEREVKNNFRHGFAEDPDAIPDGLKWLQERQCIRPMTPPDEPRRRGRPCSLVYETNPVLFEKRLQNTVYSEVVATP